MTPCEGSPCPPSSPRPNSFDPQSNCTDCSSLQQTCSGLTEQLERSEQRARSLTSVIRGLEAEVARLRKSLVDSWGEIPGECSYSKDTKEVHHGQR